MALNWLESCLELLMIYFHLSFLLLKLMQWVQKGMMLTLAVNDKIQRTILELLNQLDGFDARGDVKVILATNKIESLDLAPLRLGRIYRKIEFFLPDIKTRRRIFQVTHLDFKKAKDKVMFKKKEGAPEGLYM
ncbi:26S proteasome regulatory subunit 4 homolog B-like [Primulina tabacum]|uniref:26S proteasome regulatory subunit 4 homolog B-like n=1 Tax=Primulina tabacum TaxID=48773 RepID=UPI003F59E6FE